MAAIIQMMDQFLETISGLLVNNHRTARALFSGGCPASADELPYQTTHIIRLVAACLQHLFTWQLLLGFALQ
eukprot:4067452-Amphidinium_carterae.1